MREYWAQWSLSELESMMGIDKEKGVFENDLVYEEYDEEKDEEEEEEEIEVSLNSLGMSWRDFY